MADSTGDVLVVGYGSELHHDDAVGRRVAETIERHGLAGVTVLTSTQLVPELAEPIAAADRVVFVDASVEVDEVVVRRLPVRIERVDSHHATPAHLLGLVRSLGHQCPPAFLVEVPAFDLSLGEGLSEPASAAAERAVAEVCDLVLA